MQSHQHHESVPRARRHPMLGAARLALALATLALTAVAASGDPEAELGPMPDPADAAALNAWRLAAREHGLSSTAAARLAELADAQPEQPAPQVQLALAYLDQLRPELTPADAGVLAQRAARLTTRALDHHPDDTAALYVRALARLVWPPQLRHARFAVDDLEHCLDVLIERQAAAEPLAAVLLRLGDAQVKMKALGAAQETYARGFDLTGDPRLEARADLEVETLLDTVNAELNLTQAPDTDVAWLHPSP